MTNAEGTASRVDGLLRHLGMVGIARHYRRVVRSSEGRVVKVSFPYMVAMADAAAYGTKMPRANWQEVGSLPVPVPPIREQRTICSYLDGTTARIDNLIRHAQILVDRLREKRQALITAAVNGQIDLRGEEETTA